MLDGVSLDQLRAFAAAVDEGNFSAAGRKLFRAQSAISDLIAGLEAQMDVQLFDRSGRYPALTAAGTALLADARAVLGNVDAMKARAKGMSAGIEPELAVVVDVLFPMAAITAACRGFRERFPGTPLRLFVEALGATYQRVLDGSASVGIATTLPKPPPGLVLERIVGLPMAMVAAPGHPLAAHDGPVPPAVLAGHAQLVLTDRSTISDGFEFGVFSPSTWRLSDLFAKHAFLLDGLGWGSMPLHVVEGDIAAGRLVRLRLEDAPADDVSVSMSAVWPAASPPGPAGRWFVEQLRLCRGHQAALSAQGR